MPSLQDLLNWTVIGWIIALLVSLGVAMISLNEALAAKICLGFSAAILFAKVLQWATRTQAAPLNRFVVVLLICGLLAVASVESFRWADRKIVQQPTSLEGNSEPAATSPERPPIVTGNATVSGSGVVANTGPSSQIKNDVHITQEQRPKNHP